MSPLRDEPPESISLGSSQDLFHTEPSNRNRGSLLKSAHLAKRDGYFATGHEYRVYRLPIRQ
ncbi:MAG: hypothetical protein O2983_11085, partial [Planctomycetota bacterium]|nr:hypothetical protein [Planctomycetota bacterium]